MVRMVSLDTASNITGWAYWGSGKLKKHGTIDLSQMKRSPEKLDLMCKEIIKVLKKFNPDIIVIEMTVVPNNAGTQRMLSEIVGVVRGYSLSCDKDITFIRLRPTEWRKLVKGNINPPKSKKDGLKEWDIKRCEELYLFKPIDDNEADAVLIGSAYINMF